MEKTINGGCTGLQGFPDRGADIWRRAAWAGRFLSFPGRGKDIPDIQETRAFPNR